MTSPSRTVWLDAPQGAWETFAVPDGHPVVQRMVLHTESEGGASVQAVRFPPGWRRDREGHYTADEELVVLRGALVVSGVQFQRGDFGLVPAWAPRYCSAAGPDGCLAVAWFPRPPLWVRGAGGGKQGDLLRCPVADVSREVARGVVALVGSEVPRPPRPHPLDVVSGSDQAWAWVPPTAHVPQLSGPLLVRAWPGTHMGAASPRRITKP